MAAWRLIWILVGLLFIVFDGDCFLLPHNQQSFEQTVDHILQKVLQCHRNVPGLTVGVVKDGHVLMTRAYGVKDETTRMPMSSKSLVVLGSVSKAFTATLMVKQLAAHNLTIHAKVADIFGHGFHFSSAVRTENAEIRDLLSHTMGFPKHDMVHLDPTLTRQTLPSRMQYLKSDHPFRSRYEYNNIMYGLVTAVSETLGGRSWEDLVRDNLYTPLGMSSSSFVSTVDLSASNVAQGYITSKQTGRNMAVPFQLQRAWSALTGAIGVMSNADDMARWMLFHLSGGKSISGSEVVDKDVLSAIYVPRIPIRKSSIQHYFSGYQIPVQTNESSYAFGWRNGHYRGYPILRHTGTISGYSSLLTLIPDSHVGIFTSMTGSDPDGITRTLIHNYLADIALGDTPWLNETTICTFPEPWIRKPVTTHTAIDTHLPFHRDIHEYVGMYHNDFYGNITLHISTPHHHLVMQYGIASWFLYPHDTADGFSGKGHGLISGVYDVHHILFRTHSSRIHSVVISSFEPADPPVFKKVPSHGGSIVG